MDFGRVSVDELLAHAAGLRRLAVQLVEDTASADDLVQETLIAGLQYPSTEARPLGPWLARVLRNLATQGWRIQKRRAELEQLAARAMPSPSAAELVERMELQRVVADEVLKLPEPWRAAILACYFDDARATEHAQALGIPASTVRSQLRRGIELLRQRLDERSRKDGTDWTASLIALGRITGKTEVLKRAPLFGHHALLIAKGAVILTVLAAGALLIAYMNGRDASSDHVVAAVPAMPRAAPVPVVPVRTDAQVDDARPTTASKSQIVPEPAPPPITTTHKHANLKSLPDELRAAVEESLAGQIDPNRFLDAALMLLELDVDDHTALKPSVSGTPSIPLRNAPEGMAVELWLEASKSTEYASETPSLRISLAPPNDHYSIGGIRRGKAAIQITLWMDPAGAVSRFSVLTDCQFTRDDRHPIPIAEAGRIVTGALYHFDADRPLDAAAGETGVDAGVPFDTDSTVLVRGVPIGERVPDLMRLNAGFKVLRSKVH